MRVAVTPDSSRKAVPRGVVPEKNETFPEVPGLTVAVNVTGWLKLDGFGEAVSVMDVTMRFVLVRAKLIGAAGDPGAVATTV